jgi:hypothetical protein
VGWIPQHARKEGGQGRERRRAYKHNKKKRVRKKERKKKKRLGPKPFISFFFKEGWKNHHPSQKK